MARMVPSYISEDTKSPGEKALFHKFREDPGTSGWIVLHSLGVAKHKDRISGELDFVVIIPREGVLCIEVKAGNVARKEGYWLYGSGEKPKKICSRPISPSIRCQCIVLRNILPEEEPSLNRLLSYHQYFLPVSILTRCHPSGRNGSTQTEVYSGECRSQRFAWILSPQGTYLCCLKGINSMV